MKIVEFPGGAQQTIPDNEVDAAMRQGAHVVGEVGGPRPAAQTAPSDPAYMNPQLDPDGREARGEVGIRTPPAPKGAWKGSGVGPPISKALPNREYALGDQYTDRESDVVYVVVRAGKSGQVPEDQRVVWQATRPDAPIPSKSVPDEDLAARLTRLSGKYAAMPSAESVYLVRLETQVAAARGNAYKRLQRALRAALKTTHEGLPTEHLREALAIVKELLKLEA
jgi:hypothetical protein